MVMSAHDLPAVAWSSVSDAARRALGLPPVAVVAGAQADLMAVPAATLREAIAYGPGGRKVWKRGTRFDEIQR
jgi:cytosine deaminase